MSTDRKVASDLGPRVVAGRLASGDQFPRELSSRVKAVRKAQGLTWPQFEHAIRMTEKTRRRRTSKNPSPFTAEELASIARELRAEPAYLLLGKEPILHEVTVTTKRTGRIAPLSERLYAELTSAVCSHHDVEPETARRYLPSPLALFGAIKRGVTKGWADNLQKNVKSRMAVTAAVRREVGARYLPPKISTEAVRAAVIEQHRRRPPQPSTHVIEAIREFEAEAARKR